MIFTLKSAAKIIFNSEPSLLEPSFCSHHAPDYSNPFTQPGRREDTYR